MNATPARPEWGSSDRLAPITPAHDTVSGGRGVRSLRRAQTPSESSADIGNVTEIIMPAGQVENMQLLLPMLTQLNQERRWLAWIDPPQAMITRWQQTHGIVASEILVLHSSEQHDALSLAEKALEAGTCHAVVMWTEGSAGESAFQRLQTASVVGDSHGVILRRR
ncbi:LexA family transcriptional regulator [Tamilnaduibacter salinus]|nr:LexA family transcriptional regulator [Tamilnaduibacter salinus]